MALGNPLPLLLSTVGGYEIEKSLRFNDDDTAYLTRTPSSASNRKTWTFSAWVKRGPSDYANLLSTDYNTSGTYGAYIGFFTNKLRIYDNASGSVQWHLDSDMLFRDYSSWYHIVVAVDTTQGTNTNRVKAYVNGTQISLTATTWPDQNDDGEINSTEAHTIGIMTVNGSADYKYDGYMAEMHFVDGTALDASSFGETNEDTGQWIPKKYAGTYGTNGFYLDFKDNSGTTATTLGKDSSGNGNNFTPQNFSVSAGVGNDSLEDTPTNNYSTLNPLNGLGSGFYASLNGALDYNITDTAYIGLSTIAVPTSGKWYAECTATDVESLGFGLRPSDWHGGLFVKGYLYLYYGKTWKDNAEQETVTAISDGDIVGCAVDRTAGTVQFSLNGTNKGSTLALVADEEYYFWVSRGASSGGAPIGSVNFGQRAFSHQPSGFKGLCTSELPTPTIKKPTDYFNTVLYTGNGAVKTVTGAGFQPDLLINKRRDSANVTLVVDSGIGTAYGRSTALTDEDWASNVTLNSDGFVTANTASSAINHNGGTYVSHFWKESATAGFDIVTYTGTGSNPQTRAHSLGVAPEMIILKNRSGTNDDEHWAIYHHKSNATPEDYWARMNTTGAFEDLEMWNDTAPTSSVFTTQNHAISNYNGDTFVAYLFSSVEGYSKAGGYSGNGNANGAFVYLGFKPAFLLIKCTNSAESWEIYDNKRLGHNVNNESFFPDLDNAESSEDRVDLLSNGFKARINSGGLNGSSKDYIYLAFAETPFKYATAR